MQWGVSRCAPSQANEVALSLMFQQCEVERGEQITFGSHIEKCV